MPRTINHQPTGPAPSSGISRRPFSTLCNDVDRSLDLLSDDPRQPGKPNVDPKNGSRYLLSLKRNACDVVMMRRFVHTTSANHRGLADYDGQRLGSERISSDIKTYLQLLYNYLRPSRAHKIDRRMLYRHTGTDAALKLIPSNPRHT
jgi:hypothetical protein